MLKNNRSTIPVNFAGNEVQLLVSGACYWPSRKTLIVADLHLEKGSYFALRGQPLPIADTRNTLEKLRQEIVKYQPETVICLGDNVHDAKGFLRMKQDDLFLLQSLRKEVTNWLWIIGNHDTAKLEEPAVEKMQFVSEVLLDNLCFTHDFQKDKPIQIIGHYHPKISIKRQGVKISGKCFLVTENTLILPAFGSYTGGLDIHNKVYGEILSKEKQYYLIFQDTIFYVK